MSCCIYNVTVGHPQHPLKTSCLSVLLKTPHILISELTIPERACGVGLSKTNKRALRDGKWQAQFTVPRGKGYFAIWSLILPPASVQWKKSFFAHSGSDLKRRKHLKTELLSQCGCDICWEFASRDNKKIEEQQSLTYSCQAIKELLVDRLFRGTSISITLNTKLSELWAIVYGKIPIFSVSAPCWQRVRSDDLDQR